MSINRKAELCSAFLFIFMFNICFEFFCKIALFSNADEIKDKTVNDRRKREYIAYYIYWGFYEYGINKPNRKPEEAYQTDTEWIFVPKSDSTYDRADNRKKIHISEIFAGGEHRAQYCKRDEEKQPKFMRCPFFIRTEIENRFATDIYDIDRSRGELSKQYVIDAPKYIIC